MVSCCKKMNKQAHKKPSTLLIHRILYLDMEAEKSLVFSTCWVKTTSHFGWRGYSATAEMCHWSSFLGRKKWLMKAVSLRTLEWKKNPFLPTEVKIKREEPSSAPLYNELSLCGTEEQKKLKIQFMGNYYSEATWDTGSKLAWGNSLTLQVYFGELFWQPLADWVTG